MDDRDFDQQFNRNFNQADPPHRWAVILVCVSIAVMLGIFGWAIIELVQWVTTK